MKLDLETTVYIVCVSGSVIGSAAADGTRAGPLAFLDPETAESSARRAGGSVEPRTLNALWHRAHARRTPIYLRHSDGTTSVIDASRPPVAG